MHLVTYILQPVSELGILTDGLSGGQQRYAEHFRARVTDPQLSLLGKL